MDYNDPPLDPNDPLGTDLALDSNGDLILTPQGDVQTVSEIDNIKQAVRIRLQTIPDSYLFGDDLGSDLGETVDEALTPQAIKLIEQYAMNALEDDPRIIQINNLSVTSSDDQLTLSLDLDVVGVGSVQTAVAVGGGASV